MKRGELSAHIDFAPTALELAGRHITNQTGGGDRFDGISLAPLLRGEQETLPGDRVHFIQYRQNTEPPDKWTNAVMTRRWRLVRGTELYDIKADPEQRRDVAADHPEVIADLRKVYDTWWEETLPFMVNETVPYSPVHPQVERYNKQLKEKGIPEWKPSAEAL